MELLWTFFPPHFFIQSGWIAVICVRENRNGSTSLSFKSIYFISRPLRQIGIRIPYLHLSILLLMHPVFRMSSCYGEVNGTFGQNNTPSFKGSIYGYSLRTALIEYWYHILINRWGSSSSSSHSFPFATGTSHWPVTVVTVSQTHSHVSLRITLRLEEGTVSMRSTCKCVSSQVLYRVSIPYFLSSTKVVLSLQVEWRISRK